ncbi:MAG: TRAFs-binding domain-containing protein [Pyrinomonadaceae bacterium]
MSKPLCFVIMGYGKKIDYPSGQTFDLDKTYRNVIKPAAEKAGYECVRGDEVVRGSELIDTSMYAMILKADLVIADISTYNPNALYELGIRHAARPFSTIIIMKETTEKIPFDLSHSSIFHYKHLGEDIGVEEAKRCVDELVKKINSVKEPKPVDSPVYVFIEDLAPLKMSDDVFAEILAEYANREDSLFATVETAKQKMKEKNFAEAAKAWKKASEIAPGEPYYIQQRTLATYKADEKNVVALTDALRIIEQLNPDTTNDPETLGITGAIYKRLWSVDKTKPEYLKRATEFYKRGFSVNGDYYNGENYATCLDMSGEIATDPEEAIYYKFEARRTRQDIVKNLLTMDAKDIVHRNDAIWMYASISNISLALGDAARAAEYEEKFMGATKPGWERDTFNATKEAILAKNK